MKKVALIVLLALAGGGIGLIGSEVSGLSSLWVTAPLSCVMGAFYSWYFDLWGG